MIVSYNKTLLLAGIAFISLPVSAQAAKLDPPEVSGRSIMHVVATQTEGQKAEAFINSMGDRALGFLSNSNLSKAQKQKEFKKLLNASFDMKTIGRFALGRNWRSATPVQQKEYLQLFENMIVDVYSSRFGEYKGEKFKVNGHRNDGKKDILVNSFIVPNGGSQVKVDWRVRDFNGTLKVIDVIIEGVSMSLTQRSDFSSVIQRGGGKVEVLLEHLRKK